MKVTKRELLRRIEALEKWSEGADGMLTELNHALPDPEYDAKCEAEVADVEASLDRHRERLGLNKPQLKQLDQSVFNGLDEKWRFAAVDGDGRSYAFMRNPKRYFDACFVDGDATQSHLVGEGYDASNWQNSLIERGIAKELLEVDLSSELTGSDLCRAMLERGDKAVLCRVGNINDEVSSRCCAPFYAITHVKLYEHEGDWHFFHKHDEAFLCAVPVNNQGEPLTASEVGL